MDQIEKDVIAAMELNLSYGYYKALSYNPYREPPTATKKKTNRRPRKFTDLEAFALWQAYMTDAEIGSTLGVSRAYIQRWRDQLELPSTSKTCIDTKKYRLTTLRDGTYIVVISEQSTKISK